MFDIEVPFSEGDRSELEMSKQYTQPIEALSPIQLMIDLESPNGYECVEEVEYIKFGKQARRSTMAMKPPVNSV